MAWKEVLNTAKETGERIIGHGPEVDFRREINKEVAIGTPKPRAEKEAFLDRVDKVGDEARLSGAVDYKSKNWRDFEAALNELFDQNDRNTLREDSENPLFFRTIPLGPVSAVEYNRARSYYQGKFDGQSPKHYAINDTANNVKLINELANRIYVDLSPYATNIMDIKAVLTAHPEIGADIGKAMGVKEELEGAEERFSREILHKKEWEQYKKDAGESLKEMILDIPLGVLGKMTKETGKILKNPSQKNIGEAIASLTGAVITATAKELLEAGKFLYGGTKTTLLWLNKLRK